jgi:hypothetical protein
MAPCMVHTFHSKCLFSQFQTLTSETLCGTCQFPSVHQAHRKEADLCQGVQSMYHRLATIFMALYDDVGVGVQWPPVPSDGDPTLLAWLAQGQMRTEFTTHLVDSVHALLRGHLQRVLGGAEVEEAMEDAAEATIDLELFNMVAFLAGDAALRGAFCLDNLAIQEQPTGDLRSQDRSGFLDALEAAGKAFEFSKELYGALRTIALPMHKWKRERSPQRDQLSILEMPGDVRNVEEYMQLVEQAGYNGDPEHRLSGLPTRTAIELALTLPAAKVYRHAALQMVFQAIETLCTVDVSASWGGQPHPTSLHTPPLTLVSLCGSTGYTSRGPTGPLLNNLPAQTIQIALPR